MLQKTTRVDRVPAEQRYDSPNDTQKMLAELLQETLILHGRQKSQSWPRRSEKGVRYSRWIFFGTTALVLKALEGWPRLSEKLFLLEFGWHTMLGPAAFRWFLATVLLQTTPPRKTETLTYVLM